MDVVIDGSSIQVPTTSISQKIQTAHGTGTIAITPYTPPTHVHLQFHTRGSSGNSFSQ